MKDELNKDQLPSTEDAKQASHEANCNELSEDIEVVGPGQMLSEARISRSLTQEQVANKLNFCTSLVKAIEQDVYDQKLPATFNRGYLRNYAKLVGISPEDIIASYESLGAAQIQRTEMQSFSNNTAKQAEHSLLMWISYLIIAILFASTILWWVQGERKQNKEIAVTTPTQVTENISEKTTPAEVALSENIADNSEATNAVNDKSTVVQPVLSSPLMLNQDNATTDNIAVEETVMVEAMLDRAVFTFSGDCWVNIFDANNERIAWGIKKLGYVMVIEGKGPFRVTIGKPELVSITFNDMPVDMAKYNSGNIAKFTLPVIEDN
mgnify:CR=1 FL=1